MGILNNKGKPKHKRLRRHIGKPLTALAAVLCVAVAPVASANMNIIDVSGWQSADVTRVVDATRHREDHGGWRLRESVLAQQTDWARQTGKACGGYHYADGGNVTPRSTIISTSSTAMWASACSRWTGSPTATQLGATATGCASGSTRCIRVPRSGRSCTCRIPPYIRFRPTCAHCMLWKAQYASMNATGWQSTPWNAGSKGEGMVQYASTGYLNGVGPLDLNLFFGERDAWQKIANGDRGKTHAEVRHDPVRPQVTATPDYDDMATKVIRGVYGNGNERRQALGGAYDRVMAIVNQRLGGGSTVSAPANTNCGSVCVTVKSGDTLSTIAARNGGSWNQYTGYRSGNPNIIYAGETVCVVAPASLDSRSATRTARIVTPSVPVTPSAASPHITGSTCTASTGTVPAIRR